MIKQIRTSKATKVISCYLALMLLMEMLQPMRMYALTGGPSQPEFQAFTPIGTSDMVDLASGDFSYNIPIMDVGGYPLNLAYNSNITMDQEASWVGLGWDLNVGQVNRQMRGIPDDFNGDPMLYENNMRDNITIGSSGSLFVSAFGAGENLNLGLELGMGVKYNNYEGFGFSTNAGINAQINSNLNVGVNLEASGTDGVSISPSVSFSERNKAAGGNDLSTSQNLGVTWNNRKGLEAMTMSASFKDESKNKESSSFGGSISFADASYTPTKRAGMRSQNFLFNANIETTVFGIDGGGKFSGYRNTQGIKHSERIKEERSFGYENSGNATLNDIMDFNREKDRTICKNTTTLPITNYTYDLYSIKGQGIGGQFRPYRSQVGYVCDNAIYDDSFSGSLGIEIGAGELSHFGFNGEAVIGDSHSRLWTNLNPALYRMAEQKSGNDLNYEKVYFKTIGGSHVDYDYNNLFVNKLDAYNPIKFKINGGPFSRQTDAAYTNKYGAPITTGGYINRTQRVKRNQTIEKLNRTESRRYGSNQISKYSIAGKHDHHTSEIRVTKEGGERYNYGKALYNTIKREATFDVGEMGADCITNLVTYNPGSDNSTSNHQSGDQYFNRVTTPAYAHTFLLTSVLSPDYQDLKADGPTDDDLGTYTKFDYSQPNGIYKWRVPYDKNTANYDEGLRTLQKDNKGNYQYGEKETAYLSKIETKTHVAIFHISKRKDGHGVLDENGGLNLSASSYKLDKISLYSKPEYNKYLADDDPSNDDQIVPIKEAHFIYGYSLCKGIENNEDRANGVENGKLTLQKVYFTYKNSKMGMYTPYVFDYGDLNDSRINPNYSMKAYDIWGNYKPNITSCDQLTNAEYPYVEQGSRENADKYASAWMLRKINLPSGGVIDVDFEADDYQYVQNREAMEMFKVVGMSDSLSSMGGDSLGGVTGGDKNFVTIQTNRKKEPSEYSVNFVKEYFRGLEGQDIYFRFLTNMGFRNDLSKHEYVTGYLNIKNASSFQYNEDSNHSYITFEIETNGLGNESPIRKAGFFFGRQYLQKVVFGMLHEEDTNDLEGVVTGMVEWIPAIMNMFNGPDATLRKNGIASHFVPGKSWVRLKCPDRVKIGGGNRVKAIKMHDNWDVMTNHPDNEIYSQTYGQEYSYKLDDLNGTSSGVATYEPIGGKENPFVEPFYDRAQKRLLLGPDTKNYIEKPFGESFFPAPRVTYRRVTVKNLDRSRQNGTETYKVKKNATGSVVTEFYTSFDFPVFSDLTVMSKEFDRTPPLGALLGLNVREELTLTQGYAVQTNDMDGKMKRQRVYAEGQKTNFISGADYNYSTKADPVTGFSSVESEVNTVDYATREVKKRAVGIDYDVINDFRENQTNTTSPGVAFNNSLFLIGPFPVDIPVPIPSFSSYKNQLRTAVTTKVVHSTGILTEKVAYDRGAKVSTRNLLWDAETGEVIATETTNEYNDNLYGINYPAYWSYRGMSQSAKNTGLTSDIESTSDHYYKFSAGVSDLNNYLIDGDEVFLIGTAPQKKTYKGWVVNVNKEREEFMLIDRNGMRIVSDTMSRAQMKVIRSGFRNRQMDNMASITSTTSPIVGSQIDKDPYINREGKSNVLNASAVTYKQEWPAQCECELPVMKFDKFGKLIHEYDNDFNSNDDIVDIHKRAYNPYLNNVLGQWRADKSYAYVTTRNALEKPVPRISGFFKNFNPFYVHSDEIKGWVVSADTAIWQAASKISKYSPYGNEIENRDALGRYSSALYGYNNRFPTAVAANTAYRELGYDGFEDYDFATCTSDSHFNFYNQLVKNNVSVSDKYSHTGRRSLKIAPKQNALLLKQIVPCPNTGERSRDNKIKSPGKGTRQPIKAAQPVKATSKTTNQKLNK